MCYISQKKVSLIIKVSLGTKIVNFKGSLQGLSYTFLTINIVYIPT